MENNNNIWSYEQHALIAELIQGMELTKQLRVHLNSASSFETRDSLMQRILSSYEKSLLILNCSGSINQPQNNITVAGNAGNVPESPISMNGSPGSDDFDGGHTDASKKRKTMPRWTEHVRVTSENGLEGPHDDGYSWRKYGQKDILGARYPRSYYRCTYRNTQNCSATKQVQRSDEDPTVFEFTYRGIHTCAHSKQFVPTSASPQKQDQKQQSGLIPSGFIVSNNNQQQQLQGTLFNFQKTLRVNTEELDNKETAYPFSFPPAYESMNSTGSYSPSFISPATPEPSYCILPFRKNNYAGIQNLQHSESDFNEIISANTSAANSPITEADFTLQPLEMNPNFPFDTTGFFT